MAAGVGGSGAGRASPRRLAGLVVALGVLGALTVWRLARDPAGEGHAFSGPTMGTTYQVTVDAPLDGGERRRVRDAIEARLDRVNGLMSTYDSTSELARFNRHLATDPFPVSTELLQVLTVAREISERSGGAFDVTVAPLVDAWGFGPPGRPAARPADSELAALRARVGYDRLVLDPVAGTISKTVPETVVDLSAIAKGYAVESVAAALKELGLDRFLVEVGGEVKAVGTRADRRAWRVGIERPDVAARAVHGVVELVDEAVATSGDYRNFYEEDGRMYAHVIDPRTGLPVPFRGASVSVAHPDATVADAWATALTVLGPDAGFELARREELAAVFVMRSTEGFETRVTPRFEGRLELVGGGVR